MATFTFSPKKNVQGSNETSINIDCDGRPWGRLRTFRDTKTTKSPWTIISNNGGFEHFYNKNKTMALKVAMEHVKAGKTLRNA